MFFLTIDGVDSIGITIHIILYGDARSRKLLNLGTFQQPVMPRAFADGGNRTRERLRSKQVRYPLFYGLFGHRYLKVCIRMMAFHLI